MCKSDVSVGKYLTVYEDVVFRALNSIVCINLNIAPQTNTRPTDPTSPHFTRLHYLQGYNFHSEFLFFVFERVVDEWLG